MKRLVLLMVLLMSSITFYGQKWDSSKPDKRWTFGVRAGVHDDVLAYTIYSSSGSEPYFDAHVGFVADYNISKSIALEAGLYYYSLFGFENSSVRVPVSAIFKFYLNEKTDIRLNIGFNGGADDEDNTLYGGSVGIGLCFSHFVVGLQYEQCKYVENGFADEDLNLNIRFLSLSIGYNF